MKITKLLYRFANIEPHRREIAALGINARNIQFNLTYFPLYLASPNSTKLPSSMNPPLTHIPGNPMSVRMVPSVLTPDLKLEGNHKTQES